MLGRADDLDAVARGWYRVPHRPYVDLLAWEGDDIVGVITGTFGNDFRDNRAFDSLDLPAGQHAFLTRLYVDKAARGDGIGGRLVRAFAEEAEGHQCTFIAGELDMSSDPRDRTAFFAAHGFTITDADLFGATPRAVIAAVEQQRG
ncbi:N-acetyltransferase family protein [Microbacterium gorillae]|uniref:GNAT family N-acetyltransferase n=1 Tax=Microbacterium gorillae TaxID=1231063 RepID=UPI003D97F1FD